MTALPAVCACQTQTALCLVVFITILTFINPSYTVWTHRLKRLHCYNSAASIHPQMNELTLALFIFSCVCYLSSEISVFQIAQHTTVDSTLLGLLAILIQCGCGMFECSFLFFALYFCLLLCLSIMVCCYI